MNQEDFKIGDRVRITAPDDCGQETVGKIGTIVGFNSEDPTCPVEIDGVHVNSGGRHCALFDSIEPLVPVLPVADELEPFLVLVEDQRPMFFPDAQAVRGGLPAIQSISKSPIRIFEIAAEYTPKFETRVTLTKRSEKKETKVATVTAKPAKARRKQSPTPHA